MRSEIEIKNLLLDFARNDKRIRAVLLNGSRANPKVAPDIFQDFDVTFIVDDLQSFIAEPLWIDAFGEKIISQLPDEMELRYQDEGRRLSYGYLMLFKDKNRIDLTLFPLQQLKSGFHPDSLTAVWLDKDNLFADLPPANDRDYLILKPTEKEFSDTCNEFWWVSTYVAKGLLRRDIIYAKEMLERVVRPIFMRVIEWKVGVENNFAVSVGKAGKYLALYVPEDFYRNILFTYSNAELEENWRALLLMIEIFQASSNLVADNLSFNINKREQLDTMAYLRELYNNQSKLSTRR